MGYQEKCQLAVCTCTVQVGDSYCSDYCRQAAAQGIPKNFCQCTHAACGKPAGKLNPIHAVDLPSSISFAPGRVTIKYSTREDLRDQLMLLVEAVQSQQQALQVPVKATPRAPSSTGSSGAAAVQSA